MTEREISGSGVIPTVSWGLTPQPIRVVTLMLSEVRAMRLDALRWPRLYA
jgi:hypothetical protein